MLYAGLPKHVSWISSFAPSALELLRSAFVGEFTSEELGRHPLWPRFAALIDTLEFGDFTNRSWHDLHMAGVISESEQAYLMSEASGCAIQLATLRQDVTVRAATDEAEQFLALLGNPEWYEAVEATLEAWGKLRIPSATLGQESVCLKYVEGVKNRDFWVRSWEGEFTTPEGQKFSKLSVFESTLPDSFDLAAPHLAYQDMARVTRKFKQGEPDDTLYLCVNRTTIGAGSTTPCEQWTLVNADASKVEYLTSTEVLTVLQNAVFDTCSKCPIKSICKGSSGKAFCAMQAN